MKWTALLVLVCVGLVSGDGAWKQNKDYNYKLSARTLMTSPESNNKWTGVAYRLLITIRPQSNDLLSGLISQFEYATVSDREYNEITIPDSIEYEELSDMNKPFAIHLESGIIRKVSADPSLARYESDVLKIALSQFQVNTNAENLIQDEANRLPTENDSNAFYKVMEPTATGNCETLYDVKETILNLENDGKLIEITKTRNNSNCDKIGGKAASTGDVKSDVEGDVKSDDEGDVDNTKVDVTYVDEEVSSIAVGGSFKDYTIASSVTSQTISVNGIKSFYKNVNVKLESVGTVEQSTVKFEYAPDSLVDIGSLVVSDSPSDLVPSDAVAMSDIALTELLADKGTERKMTNCWGSGTSGENACQSDLGPDYEYVQRLYKSCGWWRYAYVCRKISSGCMASDCFSPFVHTQSTYCEKRYGTKFDTVGHPCDFDNGCFIGFCRNRCCPTRFG